MQVQTCIIHTVRTACKYQALVCLNASQYGTVNLKEHNPVRRRATHDGRSIAPQAAPQTVGADLRGPGRKGTQARLTSISGKATTHENFTFEYNAHLCGHG
ncbi:hypothetical protein VOLCADRAFT_88989 [Volvox carteri f. nagariensis]|uniref:Uncharacterized protein n=1 Tax=Volvox carteri f. nagariensis TaxID=3068 RepID=D8TQH7_VOLCA|nr:uncharacterized protein VOLCADRAFT_88989 [Volvox carteri f. nagariensis]EFJ50156.1 hypothetical protein VOLCADRAFT_88989 [Volvox carteri f. nagariensis]|eukprot:XP_002948776.1 hypothetical protein VOLCADRAFT_88989 [Volvox carteri f. nagariensis]